MKHSPTDLLEEYVSLVRRYHRTLDLISDSALGSLDRLVEEGTRYGRMAAQLSPAPQTVLDLGSGVGLPGVPLAIALPGSRVLLVERRRRRVAFLRIVSSQLGLSNLEVAGADVRTVSGSRFDLVTAQAVGTFGEVYALTRHLHGVRLWLMSRKGPGWRGELRQLERQLGSPAIETREETLGPHGRLAAVLLPGGSACPPSG